MVFVKVSETYDLSTKTNKMSLIGVHTPDVSLIRKNYPGLAMNCRFFRIVSQDVRCACASMQPADPLQIGTEAGDIAPEDMFNPILYKAVTNDSMSSIEARMHGMLDDSDVSGTDSVEGHQVVVENDTVTGLADEFPVYYAFLSNRQGWRTANPQAGFVMNNLKPLVFEKLYDVGACNNFGTDQYGVIFADADGGTQPGTMFAHGFRGNAKPMPRLPTTYVTGTEPLQPGSSAVQGTNYQLNGMAEGTPANFQMQMTPIPTVFTACVIVPPSRLHKLYYRMVVETTVEFSEIRPMTEVGSFYGLSAQFSSDVYYNDYEDLSKRFATVRTSLIDAKDADVKKVM